MLKCYTIPFIEIPFEQEVNGSSEFGIKGGVEERGNKENSTCSREFSERLIPCKANRRRLSPRNQSKNVEP